MHAQDLTKILKEIPILLTPILSFVRGNKYYKGESMIIKKTRKDGTIMQYTVLNYNCDDIVKGLLHESIHHFYELAEEQFADELTDILFKDESYMRQCQRKIVELCGRFDL